MITIIQLIALVFSLFAWSRALLRYKDRKIPPMDFIFWTVVWSGIAVVSLFPNIISFLSRTTGVGRPIDLFVYGGIILLFYLVFRIYVKAEQQEQNITKLVRDLALRKK